MNYSLLFHLLIAGAGLTGFAARYFKVLTHRGSARDGRRGLAVLLMTLLYAGIIFSSVGLISYVTILKTTLILWLIWLVLEITLVKLANYIKARGLVRGKLAIS